MEESKDTNTEKKELISNLCYDSNTGRFILIDNQNNHYMCDLFGRRLGNFNSRVTGMYNRYQKKKLKPLAISQNIEKYNSISTVPKTPNKISFVGYFPMIRKFQEGCNLPKAKAPPFFNLQTDELTAKNKKELSEHLTTYFSNDFSKNSISLDANKRIMPYLTCDLTDYSSCREDFEKLGKIIDDTIENYKNQYKNKLNILNKNPIVKALKQFKNYLSLNKDTKIVNGYKLSQPPDKIIQKKNINEKIIRNRYFINKEKNNKKSLLRLINNNNDNQTKKLCSNSAIIGPDKLNDICKSKDFTIGRLIDMDFGYNDKDKKTRRSIKSGMSRNSEIIQSTSEDEKFNNRISSANAFTYKDTIETLSNKNCNLKEIYLKENKTIDEKIEDNELSFMSEMSENEKKYAKLNNLKIKSAEKIRVHAEHDNELLKGYQEESVEEEVEEDEKSKENKSKSKFKLKTNLDSYMADIQLLKLTNPKLYEKMENDSKRDLELLKKKLDDMKLIKKNSSCFRKK